MAADGTTASGDAYVTLAGSAEIIDDHSAVDCRLTQVDDPDGSLEGKLVAVRVTPDHLELGEVNSAPLEAASREGPITIAYRTYTKSR